MILETTQITTDPGTIDFGVGQPQQELLPRELLWKASQTVLMETDNSSLNYGHAKGDMRFRQALSQFLAPAYRAAPDPANFVTTNGASQALHLIASIFAQPGDTVLVEEPTYFLAQQIFEDRGLKVVSVTLREDGLDLAELEKLVKKHKPALFYTIPVFQNPTGLTMDLTTRQKLVELAQKHGFLIVADEVYQLLHYTETPPPALASFVESEVVLSVGSFSKILAPGLRLGWIQTAPALQQKILDFGLLKSGGGLNHFVGCVVGKAIANGSHAAFTERLKRIYAHRVEVMDRCLHQHLGDRVQFQKPRGGYFFWLKLPRDVDASELMNKAKEMKTGFRPGVRFSSRGKLKNFIRLSFAHYHENAIEVGCERLGRCLS
jgi:2-aminoadipate transaminase